MGINSTGAAARLVRWNSSENSKRGARALSIWIRCLITVLLFTGLLANGLAAGRRVHHWNRNGIRPMRQSSAPS